MASNAALANARRILGDEAVEQATNIPEEWAHFPQVSDLFIGAMGPKEWPWGSFDTRAAYLVCQPFGLPSPQRLRAVGYALKLFPPPTCSDERVLNILAEPHTPMARHLRRFSGFYAKEPFRLAQVQPHFRGMSEAQYTAEAQRHPRQLLQALWEQRRRERALAACPNEAFGWAENVPDIQSGRGLLRVVKSQRQAVEAGLELHNCCADPDERGVYFDKIRNREIALVVLFLDGKIRALGELRFQMRVDAGWDDRFRDLLRREELLEPLSCNCSVRVWDQIMDDIDVRVLDKVEDFKDFDACVPSWVQRKENYNQRPGPEIIEMFDRAEPELRQHLLCASFSADLRAGQPQFPWQPLPWWTRGPRAAMALATALRGNRTVRWLDLSDRSVSDEGVCALAQVLEDNTTLTGLMLNRNNLGDKAAKLLAGALLVNQSVLELSLANNAISEVGAEWLVNMLGCNASLQRLDLSDNGLNSSVGKKDERVLV